MGQEIARAKINLNLHVGKLVDKASDRYFGYHPLSSLVVFADYGDELSCERADTTSLAIRGPFSKGLETDDSNLILKAYETVRAQIDLPPLKFELVKNLPIASGIGGGSADAAAALRLLKNYGNLSDESWHEIALSLGADVPVCLQSRTCIMSGIGEKIDLLPAMGSLPAVLVNNGVQVRTGKVFETYDAGDIRGDLEQPVGSLLGRAVKSRNDLELTALQVEPEISELLSELGSAELARMSGSGATCFGVFDTTGDAEAAAAIISKNYPDWWVQSVLLGDSA